MSDQELRALERAAAADPARTLAYAQALDRAGRGDEGWLALCKALEDPASRAELAARPAWTHWSGPGSTRALDAPPMRRAPRVRWTANVQATRPRLLASGLGVVTSGPRVERDASEGHELLDPRSGAERARGSAVAAWLDGEALVCVLKGRVVPTPSLYVQPMVPSGRGAVAPASGPLPRLALPCLFRLDLGPQAGPPGLLRDGRPLPVPEELQGRSPKGPLIVGAHGRALTWTPPGPMPAGGHEPLIDAQLVADQLYITRQTQRRDGARVLVHDLELRPRWRRDGTLFAANAQGALVLDHTTGDERLVGLDRDGKERWAKHDLRPRALGRDVVVALVTDDGQPVGEREPELVLLDRATGERRASLGILEDAWAAPPIVVVRDQVLVCKGGAITARALDGQTVWRVDAAALAEVPRGQITDLAPLPGALAVGLSNDHGAPGRVLCLEEGA